jgi:hypothetical protein
MDRGHHLCNWQCVTVRYWLFAHLGQSALQFLLRMDWQIVSHKTTYIKCLLNFLVLRFFLSLPTFTYVLDW